MSTQQSAEVPGADCCVTVYDIAGHQRLRTAHRHHVINAVHSAVAHFLSPHQSSGTRFQTTSKTVVLGSHWKHCLSLSTSVTSALEVNLYTTVVLCKSKTFYLLTYLLTYWRLRTTRRRWVDQRAVRGKHIDRTSVTYQPSRTDRLQLQFTQIMFFVPRHWQQQILVMYNVCIRIAGNVG